MCCVREAFRPVRSRVGDRPRREVWQVLTCAVHSARKDGAYGCPLEIADALIASGQAAGARVGSAACAAFAWQGDPGRAGTGQTRPGGHRCLEPSVPRPRQQPQSRDRLAPGPVSRAIRGQPPAAGRGEKENRWLRDMKVGEAVTVERRPSRCFHSPKRDREDL